MTATGIDVGSAVAPAPGRWSYLGPVISGLCLVHCLGLAALAPILPGAVGLFSGVTWLESCLWLVSVTGTGVSLRRAWADPRAFTVWVLAVAVGALGLVREADRLVQISLGTSVVLQLVLVARRRGSRRRSCSLAGADDCQDCAAERNNQ